MHDEDGLKSDVAALSGRYLMRTLGDVERLKGWVLEFETGSPGSLKEIERMAHKIHGSGAIFGFATMSEPAGEIEHIAARLTGGPAPQYLHELSQDELRQRMLESLTRLDRAAHAAARKLGIEPDAR